MTSPSPPPLLACPACERLTPLPPQIGVRAIVRCPHCRAQFSLQDLLVEPAVAWELVSDGDPAEPFHEADELAVHYTYSDPQEQAEPVSPGAKTVEIASPQTFIESWREKKPEEELYEPVADVLFDSNRAASETAGRQTLDEAVDERLDLNGSEPPGDSNFTHSDFPPRRLEGPLVGEFPDELQNGQPDSAPRQHPPWQSITGSTTESASGFNELPDKKSGYVPSSAPFLRNKRPRSSPIWSMLQVVLGGMAAIPISLLLMWHLLGTDVGGAAPWVAQYAPWIIPEKLRPYAPSSAMRNVPSPSQPAENLPTSLPSPAEAVKEAASELPTVTAQPLGSPSTDEQQLAGNDESVAHDANFESEFNVEEIVGPAEPELEIAALENCFALIRQTDQRLEEWNQARVAKREGLSSLARITYSELTSLARAIDRLPQQSSIMRKVREQLQPIGRQVQDRPEVRVLIEKGASFWIEQNKLSGDADSQVYGLAMIVVVDSVNQSDDGEWSKVATLSDSNVRASSLEIRIPREIAVSVAESTFKQGQSLFLLGTVRPFSEQPKDNIATAPHPRTFVASYLSPL